MDLRDIAQFPAYFVTGALEVGGWPQRRGRIRKKEVVPLGLLIGIQSQLNMAGIAIGAESPDLALKLIGDIFSSRDWGAKPPAELFEMLDSLGLVAAHRDRKPWDALNPMYHLLEDQGELSVQEAIEWSEVGDAYWKISTAYVMALIWGLSKPYEAKAFIGIDVPNTASELMFYAQHGLDVQGEPIQSAQEYIASCEAQVAGFELQIRPLRQTPEQLLTCDLAKQRGITPSLGDNAI